MPCAFQDSDSRCWAPPTHGICTTPAHGAAALIQHADFTELCHANPPFGFRPICRDSEAATNLQMLRQLRDPARCRYRSCAVVGASGNLLGARLGASIDKHDAVIRINLAPDGQSTARVPSAPHRHRPTWLADIGARTTWRVLTMEGYGYLQSYPRFWLRKPNGHGRHENMSGIPQEPLLAVSCHVPGRSQGRCRGDRLRQVFAHPEAASYLINPLLLRDITQEHFRGVRNQLTPSTGITAIAFARQLCGETHLYGFGNGSCGGQCYHYYDCGANSNPDRNQSSFLHNPKSSRGYHNFSAQAQALLRMAESTQIIPHWGRCERSLGAAPAAYMNVAQHRATRSHGAFKRDARNDRTRRRSSRAGRSKA